MSIVFECMFGDRPHKELVTEDISDGVYQTKIYPNNTVPVFEGICEVVKKLNKMSSSDFPEPDTSEAASRLERVFGPLIQSTSQDTSKRLQEFREE